MSVLSLKVKPNSSLQRDGKKIKNETVSLSYVLKVSDELIYTNRVVIEIIECSKCVYSKTNQL